MEIFVARDGRQTGPFSAERVREMIKGREIEPDDLVWYEPMVDWQPAHRVFDFSAESPTPPPPASPAAFAPSHHYDLASEKVKSPIPADRFSRLIAAVIDSTVLAIALVPAFLLAGAGAGLESNGLIAAGVLAALAAVLGLLVYQTRLLLDKGMTIGKRMISVRVVAEDGTPLGFGRIIGLRIMVPAFVGSVPLVGPIFSLLDALFIFREDRRCIHDHLAGTSVVCVETPTPTT